MKSQQTTAAITTQRAISPERRAAKSRDRLCLSQRSRTARSSSPLGAEGRGVSAITEGQREGGLEGYAGVEPEA
jgi:hypothetical protein